MKVEFLWFDDCPNHQAVLEMLEAVLRDRGTSADIEKINATDPEVARRYRFPGSPTIRIDGRDIEPEFADPGDYTPRCRLYLTSSGLGGTPERRWLEEAIDLALIGQG
jgi:hypothetical protein